MVGWSNILKKDLDKVKAQWSSPKVRELACPAGSRPMVIA